MPDQRGQTWHTAGGEGDTPPEGYSGGAVGQRWGPNGSAARAYNKKKAYAKRLEDWRNRTGDYAGPTMTPADIARKTAESAAYYTKVAEENLAARVKQGDAIREAYRARKAARPKLGQAVGLVAVGAGLFRSNKGGAK